MIETSGLEMSVLLLYIMFFSSIDTNNHDNFSWLFSYIGSFQFTRNALVIMKILIYFSLSSLHRQVYDV